MTASFTPIKLETASDKVVDQILTLIQSGELRVGDRLPGERQLAQELHVSRVPIREAFSKLEALGIIEVRRGVGATVSLDLSGALASEIWLRWLSDHQSEIVHVYEVREAVECQATRLAADHVTPYNIEELNRLIEAMQTCVDACSARELAEIDRRFHEYIASICGNDLLLQFLRAVNEISHLYRAATLSLPARAQESVEEHKVIVSGIASGDRSVARQAAARHTRKILELVREVQLDASTGSQVTDRPQTAEQGPAELPEV